MAALDVGNGPVEGHAVSSNGKARFGQKWRRVYQQLRRITNESLAPYYAPTVFQRGSVRRMIWLMPV
jgi:hypothetical protein